MEETKCYMIIDWDDGMVSTLLLSTIREPRKALEDYAVGERVKAHLNGLGTYWGEISAIDSDRKWLLSVQDGVRPVPRNPKLKLARLANTPNEPLRIPEEMDEASQHQDLNGEAVKKTVAKKRKSEPTVQEEEAKKAKSELNRKKKELMKARQAVVEATTKSILEKPALPSSEAVKDSTPEPVKDSADSTAFQNLAEILKRMEAKIDSMESQISSNTVTVQGVTNMLDAVLNCKSCMKKVYRNIDQAIPVASPSPVHYRSIKECFAMQPRSLATEEPFNAHVVTSAVCSPSTQTTAADLLPISSVVAPQKEDIVNDEVISEVDDSNSDHTFIGEAKFNVIISKENLARCHKSAKSAEKLALNLIEFLLSPEEIRTITVYGNPQCGKSAMSTNKQRALKNHIISTYYPGEKASREEEVWQKLVKVINDKIRKLRKGKYKLPVE